MKQYVITAFIVWNIITFLLMGIDKYKAKKDLKRIREKTLILCSFALGAPGSSMGMIVFHHKTRKIKFQILIPMSIIVNIALIYALIYYNIV